MNTQRPELRTLEERALPNQNLLAAAAQVAPNSADTLNGSADAMKVLDLVDDVFQKERKGGPEAVSKEVLTVRDRIFSTLGSR